jgi:ribosomal protein L37AE/L43A
MTLQDYPGLRQLDPQCEDYRHATRQIIVRCDTCGKDSIARASDGVYVCDHCGEDDPDGLRLVEVEDSE